MQQKKVCTEERKCLKCNLRTAYRSEGQPCCTLNLQAQPLVWKHWQGERKINKMLSTDSADWYARTETGSGAGRRWTRANDAYWRCRKSWSTPVETWQRRACVKPEGSVETGSICVTCLILNKHLRQQHVGREKREEDTEKKHFRSVSATVLAKQQCQCAFDPFDLLCKVCQSLSSYGSSGRAVLSNEKDTVSSRKQSFSSEEFCHYTAHWPNIHWNTEKQDTNVDIRSLNSSSIMMQKVSGEDHLPVML